ncbi:ATP-binding protein [Maricaulaceae bacterium NA33B04]|nr:ATP-binding protein [Maricaulaceae bacterium NA33B04]
MSKLNKQSPSPPVPSAAINRPELLRQVAICVAAILSIYLVAVAILLPGLTPAKIVGGISVLILLAIAWIAVQPWGYSLGAITIVGLLTLGVFGASLTNGGVEGYLTPLILTAPACAAIFLGARAALVACGAVALTLAAQVFSARMGWVSDTPYPADVTSIAAAVLLIAATAIIAVAVGVFAGDSQRLISHLTDARAEADRANAAKTKFLSNMSHELRTPLNGVLGMAQVMRDTELSDDQRHRLSIILKSGEALQDLIQDVLDLSRIEAGRMELALSSFELGPCLDDAIAATTGAAQTKRLSLTVEADPQTRALTCHHDRSRLRQVLINLLGNAVKFTEEGGATLKARETDAGSIRITVQDTGPGIPEALHELVFERFGQGEDSRNRGNAGSGLGLTIASDIIELSGGTLSLDPDVRNGAAFHIDLPLEAPAI